MARKSLIQFIDCDLTKFDHHLADEPKPIPQSFSKSSNETDCCFLGSIRHLDGQVSRQTTEETNDLIPDSLQNTDNYLNYYSKSICYRFSNSLRQIFRAFDTSNPIIICFLCVFEPLHNIADDPKFGQRVNYGSTKIAKRVLNRFNHIS